MKRCLIVVLFLLLPLSLQATGSGCGPGTLNDECGNVGDPYEGGSPPGGANVNACGTLAAGGTYTLTGNVGADASAICFEIAPGTGTTFDLGGFTVTGRIHGTYGIRGFTLLNGVVNCNYSYSGIGACIWLYSDVPYSAKTRLHHLTVHNANDPGTNEVANIYLEGTGTQGTNVAWEVDHITAYIGTAATSTRAINLRFTGGDKVDIHNNDFTCNADAAACQGVDMAPNAGYENGLIHNNLITLATNVTAGDSARGIIVSGPDGGSTGAEGWQVYSNFITANNNRAIRFRQVQYTTAHDNQVVNCLAGESGCYHLADPSNGASYVQDSHSTIYNEQVDMQGGIAFWIRDGRGFTVQNLTVTGTLGQLAEVDTGIQAPPGGPVATGLTVCNVTGASSLGTASVAQASTTVSKNSAGTWTGAGTITDPGSCTPPANQVIIVALGNLSFAANRVGKTSNPQTSYLTNTGASPLTIKSIVTLGDFAQKNNCGVTVPASSGCAINVTFTPKAVGTRIGILTVTDSAANSPQVVTLTGTGRT